jgi:hypothetical protein
MNIFEGWLLHRAAWWQFWLPQSGASGGLLAAAVILSITYLAARAA